MKKNPTIENAANIIAQAVAANPYAYLMFTNIARRISAGTHPLTAAQTEIASLRSYIAAQPTAPAKDAAPAPKLIEAEPVAVAAPAKKRGRGRPRKPATVEAAAPVKRGRGRPRKAVQAAAAPKRGRGRPRKAVAAQAAPKRGRGRPRKVAAPVVAGAPKRGRGRPRKTEAVASRAAAKTTGLPIVPEIPASVPVAPEPAPVAESEVLTLSLGGESLPPVLGSGS